jgi:hypothetical protein
MLREGGAEERSAGRVESGAAVLALAPGLLVRAPWKPFVVGVPLAVSPGGGAGLPDLPRDGRGLGVVSETRPGVVPEAGTSVVPEAGTSVVPEARASIVPEARACFLSEARALVASAGEDLGG